MCTAPVPIKPAAVDNRDNRALLPIKLLFTGVKITEVSNHMLKKFSGVLFLEQIIPTLTDNCR